MLFGAYAAWLTTTTNDPTEIQLITCGTFAVLAGGVYAYGGFTEWPNIITYSLMCAGILGAGLLTRAVMSPPLKGRYDTFASLAGVLAFVSVMFYAVSPPTEGVLRPLGLATFLLFVLPLLTGLRTMLARPVVAAAMIGAAWTASSNAYTRAGDAEFVQDTATGTRVSLSIVDNDVYIAFAGSQNATDWLRTNINVLATDYHGVGVHAGFVKAWLSVKERVLALMDDMLIRTAASGRIVITGHSLGGALATLAALDLTEDPDKVFVITFGSPQVGSTEFVRLFDATIKNSVRVVTVYDPIPKSLSGKFAHVKGAYVITRAGYDNPVSAHFAYQKILESQNVSGVYVPAIVLSVVLAALATI